MRLAVVLFSSVVAISTLAAFTQAAHYQAPEHKFTAQWITTTDAPAHDPAVLRLRKEFVLTSVPAHFMVHVSADNQFLLYVNGKRIGQGPAIGDVQHWRYETYDLAPALHPGRNLIAASVWNLGDMAPIRQISSRLGFVLDPDSPAEAMVASDSSWIARRDLGFSFLPTPAEIRKFYYVGSPGESLDASSMQWGWSDPATVASAPDWRPATAIGAAVARGVHSESNSWLLIPDPLPTMEYAPVSSGRVVRASGLSNSPSFPAAPLEIPVNTHATLLLDRETLTTAFPTLTVSGGKGSRIILRYAEALIDEQGNKGNRNRI